MRCAGWPLLVAAATTSLVAASPSWCRWRCWCGASPRTGPLVARRPPEAQSLVAARRHRRRRDDRWPDRRAGRPRTSGRPVTVFLPDGTVLGAPAAAYPAGGAGRAGAAASPSSRAGGREIVVAVQGRPDGTGGDPDLRPDAELTAGVDPGLAGAGPARRRAAGASAWPSPTGWPAPWSGRSPSWPRCRTGWPTATWTPGPTPAGPPEVREVGRRAQPPGRPDPASCCAGAGDRRRPVAPAAHPADRAAAGGRGAARPGGRGPDRRAAWTRLERAVTGLIDRPAGAVPTAGAASATRRAVVAERVAFWSVLAEDTGAGRDARPARRAAAGRRSAADDLAAAWTRCSATSSRTPRTAPRSPSGWPREAGRAVAGRGRTRARACRPGADVRPGRERGRLDRPGPGHRPPHRRAGRWRPHAAPLAGGGPR